MRVWLKELRNKKGWDHKLAAEKCKISRSFYTNIENGAKTPSVVVAQRMGKVFHVKWTKFFEDNCSFEEQSQNQSTA